MNIYPLNSYTPNIYSHRNTGYMTMPQINFQAKRVNPKDLAVDVVSVAKKFEELSPKKQRRSLFETFNNIPRFSFETLGNLMKFKDKSIPLIKEFYDITKNDRVFCEGLAFYDLDEEDLPARIEFYKKYKEITPNETYRHDVNVLCNINRYNLPLVELIGIKTNYNDDEIKLVQNTRTKEDADAKTEAWNLLTKTLEDDKDYGYTKKEKIDILNLTDKDNLPLLKKFCEHEEFYTLDYNDIKKAMESANKDNIEYKLKIFDLTDSLSDFNLDVVDCTNENNYPLVEYLVNDDDFPWDSIPKVAENAAPVDCKPRIEIYDKYLSHKPFNWDLTAGIMSETNSNNLSLAKELITDKNINESLIPDTISTCLRKKDEITKLHAYNILRKRDDILPDDFYIPRILQRIKEDETDIFNALVSNPEFNLKNIMTVMERPFQHGKPFFIKMVNNIPDGMSGEVIAEISHYINGRNITLAEEILYDNYFPAEFKQNLLRSISYIDINVKNLLCETGLKQLYDKYAEIKNTVYNNPEIYVNGEFITEYGMNGNIEKFFRCCVKELMLASCIFDKKTLDDLLRMRFDYADDYLENFKKFTRDDFEILKTLCASKNPDGKPLSSKQKLDLPTIYKIYLDNRMSLSKMEKMAEKGIVDINELNSDLMNEIFSKMNINTSDIPEDKLLNWDVRYMHLLAEELKDSDNEELFKDVINAANSNRSFKNYIQDPTNEYGCNNKAIMLDFKELNMDYNKWVNPDKKNNVKFVYGDENKERLSQISRQIEEDMNALIHSMDEVVKPITNNPVRKILYNNFNEYIQFGFNTASDQFVIPENIRESKANLTKLVEVLSNTSKEGQFTTVWNNAKNNLNNPQKQVRAKNTLMILNHLEQRLKDLENADRVKTRNLDLMIKMWDRVPQKDLFQGNYSTCCIGMGNSNGWSMPVYLLNTAFNMIELVDNNTGETVGNALCYFVKDYDNKPVFIIDNIEIKNSVQPSDEVGLKLRDAITEYAENIACDVTGRDDIQIFLGTSYNDVPVGDLQEKSYIKLSALGDFEDEVYIDAIDYETEFYTHNTLYRLA